MEIQQIRNATNKITYAGKVFLVDPWLEPRHSLSFVDIPGMPYHLYDDVKENIAMPFYDLPMPVAEVLEGVDYYIVTHIHPDHIDMASDGTVGGSLDKSVPVICHNTEDAEVLKASGFQSVSVLPAEGMKLGDITISATEAVHGTIVPAGEAMGVLFQAAEEKTLYLAGDTIFYEKVEQVLSSKKPEVIMLNCCAAETVENGRLIMNDEDVERVARRLPKSTLYLTHLDNVSHATITRQSMKRFMERRRVSNYVMPADGERVTF